MYTVFFFFSPQWAGSFCCRQWCLDFSPGPVIHLNNGWMDRQQDEYNYVQSGDLRIGLRVKRISSKIRYFSVNRWACKGFLMRLYWKLSFCINHQCFALSHWVFIQNFIFVNLTISSNQLPFPCWRKHLYRMTLPPLCFTVGMGCEVGHLNWPPCTISSVHRFYPLFLLGCIFLN